MTLEKTQGRHWVSINNNSKHTKFGGSIHPYDFDAYHTASDGGGYHTLSAIAEQIAYDLKFDERCRQNIERRRRYKLNKWDDKNE